VGHTKWSCYVNLLKITRSVGYLGFASADWLELTPKSVRGIASKGGSCGVDYEFFCVITCNTPSGSILGAGRGGFDVEKVVSLIKRTFTFEDVK
jgi:hypothetical protein